VNGGFEIVADLNFVIVQLGVSPSGGACCACGGGEGVGLQVKLKVN
jgi:hypothetical protein